MTASENEANTQLQTVLGNAIAGTPKRKAQHTPGDWIKHRWGVTHGTIPAKEGRPEWEYWQQDIEADGKIILQVTAQTIKTPFCTPHVDNLEEMLANVALVEAAPKLLAALNAVLSATDDKEGAEAYQMAVQAINMATGETL